VRFDPRRRFSFDLNPAFPLGIFSCQVSSIPAPIFDTLPCTWSTQVQREGVAQVAGRILVARGATVKATDLRQELEHARYLAAQVPYRARSKWPARSKWKDWKVLSGVVESLRRRGLSAARRRSATGTPGKAARARPVTVKSFCNEVFHLECPPLASAHDLPAEAGNAIQRANRPSFHRMVQPHDLPFLNCKRSPSRISDPSSHTCIGNLAAQEQLQSGLHRYAGFRLFEARAPPPPPRW
jgi:hypothetical protein